MAEIQESRDFSQLPDCLAQAGVCNMIGSCVLVQSMREQALTGGQHSSGSMDGPNWPRTAWDRFVEASIDTANDPQEPCLMPDEVAQTAQDLTKAKEQRNEFI